MKENDQTAASEMYIVSKNQKITNVEFVGAETVNMKQRYENMYVRSVNEYLHNVY